MTLVETLLATATTVRQCVEGAGFAVRDVLTGNAALPYGALRVETWAEFHQQKCRTYVLSSLEAVGLSAHVLTLHLDAARLAVAVLAGLTLCLPLLTVAWCCGLFKATPAGEGAVNVFWRGAIERREEAAAAAAASAAAGAAAGAPAVARAVADAKDVVAAAAELAAAAGTPSLDAGEGKKDR